MSKITKIFIPILVLQFATSVWALDCTSDKPLEVLDPKDSKFMKGMVCSELSEAADTTNHDQARCDQINLCAGDVLSKNAQEDAEATVKENLPKAALINALVEEVKANSSYNILLNAYEEKNKKTICADKKIEKSCEKNIRDALNLVSGSFSDFPNLDRGPDVDILSKFALKKLYPQHSLVTKKTKRELIRECSAKKIDFNRVCENSAKRVAEILKCEQEFNSKGCLDKEQKAIAALLNSYKLNKDSFLALEKQLCIPSRVVQPAFSVSSIASMTTDSSYIYKGSSSFVGSGILSMATNTNSSATSSQIGDGEASNGTVSDDEPTGNSPDKNNVVGLDPLQVESNETKSSHTENIEPETIVGVDSSESTVDFEDSFNEFNKNNSQSSISTNTSANTNAWNSDFSNRINEIAAEQKKKKEEEEADKRNLEITQGDKINSDKDDKKKNDEMAALVAQINTLKAKIEEMNGNVDDLKSKKVASAEDKLKIEKEALEREKSILELKKKLAALEEDKKLKQDQAIAQAAENERNRWREDSRFAARVSTNSAYSNNASDNAKRDLEKNNNAFNRAPSSFTEASSASSRGTSSASGSSSAGLVLKSAGTQAGADSSIVYMTAGELQKYPYHLSDNASAVEIEKMISGNNGASIILGNSEQIIPEVVNGVVQLDETGKVKYKRIKISVVKNDKEKAQNISRSISSVADLKQEEQKKRDLIRYQEMKNSLKIK